LLINQNIEDFAIKFVPVPTGLSPVPLMAVVDGGRIIPVTGRSATAEDIADIIWNKRIGN
jgi:hypothetical protein